MRASLEGVQEYLASSGMTAWVVADFRGANPVLAEMLGYVPGFTRRCFLIIPAAGQNTALIHEVDGDLLQGDDFAKRLYSSRSDLEESVRHLIPPETTVAMEYSPNGLLPSVSFVDAGTVEMLRRLQFEVVSSQEILQHTLARWSITDLRSHQRSARKLGRIVTDTFAFIGRQRPTEYECIEFINRRLVHDGMATDGGATVCVNGHTRLPHHSADPQDHYRISWGDLVLIDLWAREHDGPFADITWMGYFGQRIPDRYVELFGLAVGARDLVCLFLERAWRKDLNLSGWEVDIVARDYLNCSPYGQFFTHRLGHSLGKKVHGFGVNLDSYETMDTRSLVPGVAFTIEPGIYTPEFGVRTEIDVFWSEEGPLITTPVQHELVIIGE
jgi:Xaa-Pro dipeptidase